MDDDSFQEVFRLNFDDVWAFVRRRVGTSADADDVTAETFSAAWRRRDELPAGAERLWLFGAAHNMLANHHRASQRRRRLHLRLVSVDRPVEAYEQIAETDGLLFAALSALSAADRDLLLMRAWDDLSVAEIAQVLETTTARVSSRLYKARARLQKEMARRDVPNAGHVGSESQAQGVDVHESR